MKETQQAMYPAAQATVEGRTNRTDGGKRSTDFRGCSSQRDESGEATSPFAGSLQLTGSQGPRYAVDVEARAAHYRES